MRGTTFCPPGNPWVLDSCINLKLISLHLWRKGKMTSELNFEKKYAFITSVKTNFPFGFGRVPYPVSKITLCHYPKELNPQPKDRGHKALGLGIPFTSNYLIRSVYQFPRAKWKQSSRHQHTLRIEAPYLLITRVNFDSSYLIEMEVIGAIRGHRLHWNITRNSATSSILGLLQLSEQFHHWCFIWSHYRHGL